MSFDLTKKIKNKKYSGREISIWLLIRLLPATTYTLILALALSLAWFLYANVCQTIRLIEINSRLSGSILQEQLSSSQLQALKDKIK